MTKVEIKKIREDIYLDPAEYVVKITDIDGRIIFGVINRKTEDNQDGNFYFYVKGYLTVGQMMYIRISEVASIEPIPVVELADGLNSQVKLIGAPSQRVFQVE